MQTNETIIAVLDKIKYLDWWLTFSAGDGQPWLQWSFYAPDNDDPESVPSLQKCRKWKLSYHMTNQELERTAFLACKQAVEHEMCENFTYDGEQIHNPHIDPDVLVEIIRQGVAFVHREG